MASAELELQGAIVSRLTGDSELMAMISGVYDKHPDGALRPYVTIGEMQTLRDDATCVNGAQIFATLHAWSDDPGFPKVREIADQVESLLHLMPVSLATNRLVSMMHRQTRTFRDPNGITSHAVIELVANIERPAA